MACCHDSLTFLLFTVSLLTVLASKNLCNWYICHLDGYMKSHKSWSNFPTTLLSSNHYTTQLILSLLRLWNPNQILTPAFWRLRLPCPANILTYSILVNLASVLPSAHHVHSHVLVPSFSIRMSHSLSLLWIRTVPSLLDNINHTSFMKLSPRLQLLINPLFLFLTSYSSWCVSVPCSFIVGYVHFNPHYKRSLTLMMSCEEVS